MTLVGWIITGVLAGWLAGAVTGRRGGGCLTTTAVGVVGAFVGGALARAAGVEGITGFGLRSILVAALGSVVLLLVLGAIEGRGSRRTRPRR